MLSQVNPLNIVESHLKTLGLKRPTQPDTIDTRAVCIFFFAGFPFSAYQAWAMVNGYFLPADIVGVVVSAAAIVAGLLLNLLVLIYTLVQNQAEKLTDTKQLFVQIARHTFYNISFTVLASLTLVLVSLMCLANNFYLKIAGNILTFYVGTLTALALLMVLKKCHKLIDFDFQKTQGM
jgi:hypothetical protein